MCIAALNYCDCISVFLTQIVDSEDTDSIEMINEHLMTADIQGFV